MKKLSEAEIQKRLQEWRNYKIANAKLRKQCGRQQQQIAALEKRAAEKDGDIAELEQQVSDMAVLIAELQEMVFGKKRRQKDDDQDGAGGDIAGKEPAQKQKQPRPPQSYQRRLPDANEVTQAEAHDLDACPDCGTPLNRKRSVVFYEEDIPLPDENIRLKNATQHSVAKGYCNKCQKWHTAVPLPSAKVVIGDRVKVFICYLSVLMRLSFAQIRNLLRDMYAFSVSDGEIGNILAEMSQQWRPEYERIKKRLREGKGVHLDETPWFQYWMWVMADIETDDVLYKIARSRGKGNAEDLLGGSFSAIRVSDGYNAYLILAGICQLCWAHPFRYLRTLARTKTLSQILKKHCRKAYETFAGIYGKIRKFLTEPFDAVRRKQQKAELKALLESFCKPHKKDPKKLRSVKQMFADRTEEYLTCMDHEGVPCDNNKAERMLRPFVIKRLISFGNKTDRGARALEINASVLMTFWKKHEENFFPELRKVVGV